MTYLRVVSDGTPGGTRVYTEDGQQIGGVQFMSCEIRAHPEGGAFAVAVLRVVLQRAEISAESNVAADVAMDIATHSIVVGQGAGHIDPGAVEH